MDTGKGHHDQRETLSKGLGLIGSLLVNPRRYRSADDSRRELLGLGPAVENIIVLLEWFPSPLSLHIANAAAIQGTDWEQPGAEVGSMQVISHLQRPNDLADRSDGNGPMRMARYHRIRSHPVNSDSIM